MTNLQKRGKYYSINELPLKPIVAKNQLICDGLAEIYNPTKIKAAKQATQLGGTNDEFSIGDLSSKFGVLNSFERDYLAIYTDLNLPLFGVNSIIGKSHSFLLKMKEKKIILSLRIDNTFFYHTLFIIY